ncbi:MAG TPA: translation initiation factor IF-2 N-terminal domain-containing protein, partial [Saprospiraceae bacterium]|nr:translation initiation factor IF-2 N-terminal domain-containing protein [Saprospiraceae bacterium]
MAQRLIKIAKELNVGTGSIVEHLAQKGFHLDNKPTAEVTDDMLTELYKEFQKSAAIKEEADKISFGLPRQTVSNAPEESKPIHREEKPIVFKPSAEEYKPQVKVVGKIDLDPPKKEKEIPIVEPIPVIEEQPVEEVITETKVEEVVIPKVVEVMEEIPAEVVESIVDDEIIRAEAPQLKGLKILGKIDTDKFTTPGIKNKPKEAPKPVKPIDNRPGSGSNPLPNPNANQSSASDDAKKRKRKRKKLPTTSGTAAKPNTDRPGQLGNRARPASSEPKEVSKKEIEEKIKATMARLSGGGKKKRQKVRRDKRDTIREKMEAQDLERENEKLQLTEFVTVSELASLLDVPITDVITTCMNLGVIVSINQRLDAEIIELVANEFGTE